MALFSTVLVSLEEICLTKVAVLVYFSFYVLYFFWYAFPRWLRAVSRTSSGESLLRRQWPFQGRRFDADVYIVI